MIMDKLNKTLFWDTEFEKLDYKKHADFIIKRVLQYGDKKDYRIIKDKYGIKKIKEIVQKVKHLDKKSTNFWKLIFDL